MHPLLKRQLKKAYGKDFVLDENLKKFVSAIESAYLEYESDRGLLERSLELSSRDMKSAIERANEAAKAKSMFLANMSHEIRTPLNGVIGMMQILEDTKLDVEQSDYINVAINSANSLLTVINDILDFSKMEAGKFNLQNTEFNFSDWFNTTIEIMKVHAVKKNQELVSQINTKIPKFLIGDPDRLRQVLINLISNAIKFTDNYGGIIVLVEHKLVEDKIELIFSVSDTGVGISFENAEKIFVEFEQEDLTISKNFGGTGLGLAISKNIVHQMEGSLSFNSKIGVGTVFSFSAVLNTISVSEAWHSIDTDLDKSLKNVKALIIGKRNKIEENYKGFFKTFKIKARYCDSIETGLMLIKKDKDYELIILNIDESKNNVKTIKSQINSIKAKVPILLVTPDYIPALTKAFKNLDTKEISKTTLSDLFDSLIHIIDKKEKKQNMLIDQKILLAEDNEVNSKLAKLIIEKAGHQVLTAFNGEEVLDILGKNNDIGIILMDLQMPIMDGYKTTEAIKRNTKYDQIPIVALTAHAREEDKNKCIDLGMIDFLTKPFQRQDLLQLLKKYL